MAEVWIEMNNWKYNIISVDYFYSYKYFFHSHPSTFSLLIRITLPSLIFYLSSFHFSALSQKSRILTLSFPTLPSITYTLHKSLLLLFLSLPLFACSNLTFFSGLFLCLFLLYMTFVIFHASNWSALLCLLVFAMKLPAQSHSQVLELCVVTLCSPGNNLVVLQRRGSWINSQNRTAFRPKSQYILLELRQDTILNKITCCSSKLHYSLCTATSS